MYIALQQQTGNERKGNRLPLLPYVSINNMLATDINSIRQLDALIIDSGTPSLVLMERAAEGVVKEAICLLKEIPCDDKNVAIFCGKGNNGGDGLAAAYILANKSIHVTVFMLFDAKTLGNDSLVQYSRITDVKNIKIIEHNNICNSFNSCKFALIIDAIFGTGFTGSANGIIAEAIQLVNDSNLPVLSIDTPSGINCDTGEISGKAIKADTTVTFAVPKIGHFFYPAKSHLGKLIVHNIGIPDTYVKELCGKTIVLDKETAKKGLRRRIGSEHKNRFGRVLVIAGSKGMTGAAYLCARSALKSGAGIVTLLAPESLNTIYEIKLTEEMTLPLPDNGTGRFRGCNAFAAAEIAQDYDIVAIGPGLGRHQETVEFVYEFLDSVGNRPIVLDADALFPFAGRPASLAKLKMPLVITPHEGELCRITSDSAIPFKGKERIEYLRQISKKLNNCKIVLKGGPSLVCPAVEEVYINTSGNAGMATAGSGDVLTGLIAGLAAQSMDIAAALLAGVYIHGLAGDIAKQEFTEYSMTATDIINNLHKAYKELIS